MIEPRTIPDEDLAAIAHLIPGPEPVLGEPVALDEGDRVPDRALRVCEPRLAGNERAYVVEALDGNWISSQGPFVARFEAAFAEAVGTRHLYRLHDDGIAAVQAYLLGVWGDAAGRFRLLAENTTDDARGR